MLSKLSITDHSLMSSVVRCRANPQKQTTIVYRVLLDGEQTLNIRPQSYVECYQMQSKLSITDHYPMSNVVRCRANSQYSTTILCRVLLDAEQTLKNRPLSYVDCCQMYSKLSISDHYLMSSVIRCRANSQKQTTILCRLLLDVEQTLNNRPLSYVECCQMQSKLSITDNYLMSSVVRCRGNSQ